MRTLAHFSTMMILSSPIAGRQRIEPLATTAPSPLERFRGLKNGANGSMLGVSAIKFGQTSRMVEAELQIADISASRWVLR